MLIVIQFSHPLDCTPVMVTPASISAHSPIYAQLVSAKEERASMIRIKGLFKLNTSLLQEESIDYTLYSISILTNFCNKDASAREKWSLKVDSWKKTFHIMGCKLAIKGSLLKLKRIFRIKGRILNWKRTWFVPWIN